MEQQVKEWLTQNATEFRVWWSDGGKYGGESGWRYATYEEALKCAKEQDWFQHVRIEAVVELHSKGISTYLPEKSTRSEDMHKESTNV